MPPAARVTDMHTCPMITVLVPHVGGPILPPGAPTVLIGGLPAATVTNMCTCVGPPDVIIMGSTGVLINFLPAARMGDPTAHGGVIILGEPTVMIGEVGSPSPGSAGAAAVSSGLAATGHDNAINANKSAYGNPLAKGGKSQKHAVPPCSGKGMATPKNEAEFAKGMKGLQKQWPKMTPAERQAALGTLANKELAKSGVPTVGINPNQALSGTATSGQLDFPTWNLDVNPDLMKSATLSDAQTQELGDTVFHESRHAEQWYLIARNQAATKTPAQITHDTAIPATVTAAAKKAPMTKADPMAACAQTMEDSVYGKNSAHRDKVLTDMPKKDAALQAAQAKNKAVQANAASTAAQKKAAQDAENAAFKAYQANYDQYRALPEEADAWRAGGAVGKLLGP
jgi:uncharacterized Zn-binding protein involved in type VI secretion